MIDPVCFRSEAGADFCRAETHAAYIKEDDMIPLDTEQSSFIGTLLLLLRWQSPQKDVASLPAPFEIP